MGRRQLRGPGGRNPNTSTACNRLIGRICFEGPSCMSAWPNKSENGTDWKMTTMDPPLVVSYRGRGAQIEWKMIMAVEPKPRYDGHTIYFRIEW
jgi:hypothetical protein